MQAIFVAHGPFSTDVKAQHQRRSLSARARSNDGWHSTANNNYIMEPFLNVEIYNLVMKLLGISDPAAPTNGTIGFWDQYL